MWTGGNITFILFLAVTLGFFDDILIPVNALQHPSRFDETDQAWVWEYPKEDGEKHDLFMDSGKNFSMVLLTSQFFYSTNWFVNDKLLRTWIC